MLIEPVAIIKRINIRSLKPVSSHNTEINDEISLLEPFEFYTITCSLPRIILVLLARPFLMQQTPRNEDAHEKEENKGRSLRFSI